MTQQARIDAGNAKSSSPRVARWILSAALALAGGALAACSDAQPAEPAANEPSASAASNAGGTGELDNPSSSPAVSTSDVAPPGGGEGGPAPMLWVRDLASLPGRTTPGALSLELVQNVDHVSVRLNLDDARGFPASSCQTLDIYRVGPNALTWPLGGTLTLPLAYSETLPPGIYTQTVRLRISAGDYDFALDERMAHFFEVDADGLHPITSSEYSAAVNPTTNGANGPEYVAPAPRESPPDPCPPLAIPTDVMLGEGATSTVDFDTWTNVGTIQPFRWHAAASGRNRSGGVPEFEFHARDAASARIHLTIAAPSDVPDGDFETALGLGGASHLWLEEPGEVDAQGSALSAQTRWSSISGQLTAHVEGDTLSVQLTDVVLGKSRMVTEPEVTRTISSGSLRGAWIAE